MAYASYSNDFDLNFVPSLAHENFIKGMIYGALSNEGSADGAVDEFELEQPWIFKNLPNASKNLNDLYEAGYIVSHEGGAIDNGVYLSYGLTCDAVGWAINKLGLPGPRNMPTQAADGAFLATLTFTLKRCGAKGRFGAKPAPKTTSHVVRQISYTVTEAKIAYAEINRLYAKGLITERSAAGYKANVTRRITA